MNEEKELTFKSLFLPFTTKKAIIYIIVLGFVVYANMLVNGFVWDDLGYIIQNPLVHTINVLSFLGVNFFNSAAHYRPFPALYFAVQYSLFNTNPLFYHVIQLLLHLVNTILIFYLFKRFLNKNLSFFLSLIFLVHPLQVESVAYIASSDNPLFFFFGLSALILSLKDIISLKRLLAICCLLFLSLITKETGVLFIILVVLYRFIFAKKQRTTFVIAGITVSAAYILLRFVEIGIRYVQTNLSPIAGLTLFERILNIPAIIFYYLRQFVYPSRLAIEQLWVIKSYNFYNFYFPLMVIIILLLFTSLLGFYLLRNNRKDFPTFLLFSLCTIIGFGMYSQIIPLDFTVDDRWFYFPIIGLLGLIGLGLQQIKFSAKTIRAGLILGIIIITLLSIRTIIRNTNWKDPLTLYTHDITIVDNFDIENNLGTVYFNQGNYQKALIYFEQSNKHYPFEINIYNLGVTYENLGDYSRAKEYFTELTNKEYIILGEVFREKAFEGIAKIQAYKEKPTITTVEFIKTGLRNYPDSGYLWAALAYTDYKLGNNAEALQAVTKAKNILPLPSTNYFYIQILDKQPIELGKF